MTKAQNLRQLLSLNRIVRIVGAHDGLSATIVEQAGFDGVWASSLEVSASYALPDADILTMTQYLQSAYIMNCATQIPVIADCNGGYGSVNNVIHLVHEYERHGIAGICLEDKVFPKTNSFSHGSQVLTSIEDFFKKIKMAKASQTNPDFVIIARVEAFIAGHGLEEALKRAYAYQEAGADAIVIHSKVNTETEISQFMKNWENKTPIIVIPTTYPNVSYKILEDMGVKVVIYANQGLRSVIKTLKDNLKELYLSESSSNIENKISSLEEIFELQKISQWENL